MSSKPTTTDLEWTDLDQRAVDTVRVLAMDSVQKVGNGHPGTAMALAPGRLSGLPEADAARPRPTPTGPGRDRFVLSVGHSSLTLYIQLYLAGYGLELEDLETFRTWGSKTPGHPEHGHTVGVETTTGPLGQGVANAVGMAMAARYERGLFDPDAAAGESPFDHTIWAFASDGDLQEGVSGEASSLAGHQKLGNLVVLWDDNHISIEGDTETAFSEDTVKRYESYGWHVQRVDPLPDGDLDPQGLYEAFEAARAETGRPSFIAVRSIIAWPAPNAQNTERLPRLRAGRGGGRRDQEGPRLRPGASTSRSTTDVLEHARKAWERGREARAAWDKRFAEWRTANPERAAEFDRIRAGDLPDGWEKALPVFEAGEAVATRKASGAVLKALGPEIPELWGGSADLAGSNNTTFDESSFLPEGNPLPGADPLRPHDALRHPRALHGRDHERHRAARQHPCLRRHVPHLLRLHAPGRPARRADAGAGDVRVDARLDRPRRGRPHPPAGRAPARAARHPGSERRPSGGRERDLDRLGRDARAGTREARPRTGWR